MKIGRFHIGWNESKSEGKMDTKDYGTPKTPFKIEVLNTQIRGIVQQAYGIYVIPSFQQLITVQRQDPLINEAVTMMAEQIMGSDFFLTVDKDYALAEKCLDYIKAWNEKNDIREKLMDGSGQLYGMGNWVVVLDSKFGFTIVPLEALWRAIPTGSDDPLQEAYDIELHPTYQMEGSVKILRWGQFFHFRKNVLGAGWQYSSSNPWGMGFIYGMTACPVDSKGNVSPSYLDIRYGLRTASFVATMKFAVGTMFIGFPNMSNEDFEAQGVVEAIKKMSPYGGKFVTNTDVKTDLALPAKSESYQPWISQMENEINAVMATPSIQLASKENTSTKSTAFVKEKVFEFKIDAYRRVIASGMEKIWAAVLDHAFGEGTGAKAKISMIFGKNSGDYTLEGVIAMVGANIMTPEQAQNVLQKYFKYEFDPQGVPKPMLPNPASGASGGKTKQPLSLHDAATTATDYAESTAYPQLVITPLNDAVARFNGNLSRVYVDPTIPEKFHELIVTEECYAYEFEVMQGKPYAEATAMAAERVKATALRLNINMDDYNKAVIESMKIINSRSPRPSNPIDVMRRPA